MWRWIVGGLLLLATVDAGLAEAPPRHPFIDAHVHLNDPAMQRSLMTEYGIARAVVFWGRNGTNESILAAAEAEPARYIPFVSISPERSRYREAWTGDARPLLDELEALLATGRFRGIGEISVVHFPSPGFPEADFDPLSPVMLGIMAAARRHGVPVMVHCEVTRLREFAELLDRYPEVAVIWAHGRYTPLFLAERMLKRHPNLTYELSARTWPVHPRAPDYTILRGGRQVWPEWLALIEAMPARFLVGTDASHRSLVSERMKIESVQRFLDQLSPATRKAVAEENLIRLLRL
jgi:predicted TIM-barrel fold metal-dependent hydrolase